MRLGNRATRALGVAMTLALTAGAAQGQLTHWYTTLGPETPGATGSGTAHFTFDPSTSIFRIQTAWSGLSGTTTVAHIHCCVATPNTGTVGVAVTPGTLPSFPVGVTAGAYDSGNLINLSLASSFTASFLNNFGGGTIAGAQAALFNGLNTQRAYLNIHSSAFPGGEIRGFVSAVPEPSTYVLMATGLVAVAAIGWRRRRAL